MRAWQVGDEHYLLSPSLALPLPLPPSLSGLFHLNKLARQGSSRPLHNLQRCAAMPACQLEKECQRERVLYWQPAGPNRWATSTTCSSPTDSRWSATSTASSWSALHPTPYTLQLAIYTPCPTPCTANPSHYTLHPNTLCPTPYTLHPEPFARHTSH